MFARTYSAREKFNLNLINEVRKYESLYDNSHPDFRNSVIKDPIWRNIATKLDADEETCRQRWLDLRKLHSRKIRNPGTSRNNNWACMKALDFLKYYEPLKFQLPPSDSFTPKSYMYCRACLCEFTDETGKSSKCYNIFEISDLAEKLSQCSNQPVVQWDEYPQSICENCYKKIDYLSQFQTMCRISLEKFNNMLHDPNRVTFDPNRVTFDSLNSIDNDKNTNPFLNDVEVSYKENPTEQRCKETNENKNHTSKERIHDISQESKSDISYSKSDIEFDEMIVEEIIQVEIERNAEYNDHSNDEETEENIPLQMEKICDVIENNSIEVESEEFHLEIEANVIEEKVMEDKEVNLNDYIVNEQECFSDDAAKWNAKTKANPPVEANFKCDICPKTFRFQHGLLAHQRRHRGLPGYPCPYAGCKRAFNRPIAFRAHVNEHKGYHKMYKCNICNIMFKTISGLKLHKRSQHELLNDAEESKIQRKLPGRRYICETCGQELRGRGALQQHRLIHSDRAQWPYACDVIGCTKRFRLPAQLKIHKNRHAGIKNYGCPYCKYRAVTSTELKTHINTHTLERNSVCHICQKAFKSTTYLNIHIHRTHGTRGDHIPHEVPQCFQCRFCQHKCYKATDLRYHERTHTGEKPFVCKECGKCFSHPGGRSAHMQIHSKDPKHVCPECGKRFKWAASLTSHKKLHVEGATPYTCEECGQGFRWPGGYYGHKKRHLLKKMQTAQEGKTDEGQENVNIDL